MHAHEVGKTSHVLIYTMAAMFLSPVDGLVGGVEACCGSRIVESRNAICS